MELIRFPINSEALPILFVK